MTEDAKRRDSPEWHLLCEACGKTFDLAPLLHGCPACSAASAPRVLELQFRPRRIPRPPSKRHGRGLPRYLDLLPADVASFISLGEGDTPLIRSLAIGPSLGLKQLYFKNDTLNPTWSFKDRYVSVSIGIARQFGFATVAVTSTGNLGISTAAYCAAAGLGCRIVAPSDIPPIARSRAEALGASIVTVDATERQAAFEALSRESDCFPLGLFLPRPVSNPFGVEGYKTFAYELIEALGRSPAAVLFPCARGNGLYGAWKGFREAQAWGWTDKTPRLIACQPRGADSLAASIGQGSETPIELPPFTSIAFSASETVASVHALRAVRSSGGAALSLTEGQIIAAQMELARTEGLFIEASSALAVAGLRAAAAAGTLDPDQPVVCILTGPGLPAL